jgi:hypothetical protein
MILTNLEPQLVEMLDEDARHVGATPRISGGICCEGVWSESSSSLARPDASKAATRGSGGPPFPAAVVAGLHPIAAQVRGAPACASRIRAIEEDPPAIGGGAHPEPLPFVGEDGAQRRNTNLA